MVAWRTYGLDLNDYMIFLRLEQKPSLSNAAIAKEVGLSAESVRMRIHRLKSKGFLRPDRIISVPLLGERLQTEVESVYLPSRLGLLRQHVIFEQVPDRLALSKLKHICDEHPYTHYRTVAYCKNASLYAQFDIPREIRAPIGDLYSKLQEQGLFEKLTVLEGQYVARLKADFKRWDVDRDKWTVQYGAKSSRAAKTSRIEDMWDRFLKKRTHGNPAEISPTLAHPFDALDMLLLRELTVNARPNKKELGAAHGKDPTTISRRIKRLRKKVVPQEMLYYDRAVFDLTYPQLISGQFRQGSDLDAKTFYQFIESGVLPFECKGITNDGEFLLFLTVPPSFAPEFSEFFWEHASDVHIYQLQLDAAFTYYFYHENYDGSSTWNTDREYVLDTPLAAID